MSQLAAQQQALLAALFDWPAEPAIEKLAFFVELENSRGLKAYQANGHALAQRALQAAYPVLAELLGLDSFAALARAFWHAHPPLRGDVAQWGSELAAFVQHSEQLHDEPYLAAVVALEWALHRCASAADASADAASFSLLMQYDTLDLHLHLAPGCCVLASAWPVVSIWAAHTDKRVTLMDAAQRCSAKVPECAVVWRGGLRPQVRQTTHAEFALLTALLAGLTFSAALEAAATADSAPAQDDATPWDVSTWLPMAVQSGLLLGVILAEPAI